MPNGVYTVVDGWTCDVVTLDGEDVRSRCVAIVFDADPVSASGHPVAVELLVLDASAHFFVRDGAEARERREGVIQVSNLHRRRWVFPAESMDEASGAA